MTTASVCPFGADPNSRVASLLPSGFDFTDPDLLLHGIPVAEFAQLRKTAPVWWNEQPLGSTVFDDGGYWVITKHRDIRDISRDSDLWSTNKQGVVMRFADDMTKDQIDITKALLINHDAPEHTRLRKLVSRLFTPPRGGQVGGEARRCRPRHRGRGGQERHPGNSSMTSRCGCRCWRSPTCSAFRKPIVRSSFTGPTAS